MFIFRFADGVSLDFNNNLFCSMLLEIKLLLLLVCISNFYQDAMPCFPAISLISLRGDWALRILSGRAVQGCGSKSCWIVYSRECYSQIGCMIGSAF